MRDKTRSFTALELWQLFIAWEKKRRDDGDIEIDVLNLEQLEKKAIIKALEICSWSQKEAASILGLTQPTLCRRCKKHGIKNDKWDYQNRKYNNDSDDGEL